MNLFVLRQLKYGLKLGHKTGNNGEHSSRSTTERLKQGRKMKVLRGRTQTEMRANAHKPQSAKDYSQTCLPDTVDTESVQYYTLLLHLQ